MSQGYETYFIFQYSNNQLLKNISYSEFCAEYIICFYEYTSAFYSCPLLKSNDAFMLILSDQQKNIFWNKG